MCFRKKKNKVNDNMLSEYPCDVYLHNALRFICKGQTGAAYKEICFAILKSGGELTEHEVKILSEIETESLVIKI